MVQCVIPGIKGENWFETQWYSMCLTYIKPWVRSLATHTHDEYKLQVQECLAVYVKTLGTVPGIEILFCIAGSKDFTGSDCIFTAVVYVFHNVLHYSYFFNLS